ncbi:hypothetical protein Q3G72_019557 [Acer saccharum]|nr:hypothetical protein Q3G72_019557 [Acer saccharum]
MKKTPYQPEESSANKLAAKAMKRKLEEADNSTKQQDVGSSTRYVVVDLSVHKKKDDDDGDLHLAQKIMQNKQNTISGQADDEYDFEDCPSGKSWKKRRGNDNNASEKAMAKRICTQEERSLFCFENPNRPRHLVVAIANFTCLMLSRWEPVVPGHCCILPVEFKSSFGLDVIRGMLQLPEEDMHRRQRHESMAAQKLAVTKFVRDWEPFDWTKQLN